MILLTRQFALFKQTVLNDTRSIGLQLLRLLFALFIGIIIYVAQSEAELGVEIDGLIIFKALFVANVVFITFSCLFLFLPLIKEEKEENTLGMIMMTGISPFAYLTGRVGSRMFMFILILAVQIPIIYLCVTMGGIDSATILLSYALLLVLMFHLGNAFILGSMLCSNLFTGILIASGISLIFNYLFNFGLAEFLDLSRPEEPFRALAKTYDYIFSSNVNADPEIMFWTFGFYLLSGLIFFFSSVYYFDVLTEEQEELELPKKLQGSASSVQKAESLQGNGLKPIYRKLKTKRFGKLPVIYKDFRFTTFGPLLYVLQFLGITLLIYEVNRHLYRGNMTEWLHNFSHDCIPSLAIMSGIIILFSSNLLFASEIKHKTMGALLLLPKSHVKLYWHKTLCMLRIAAPTLFTLIVAFSLYIYTGLEMDYRYYNGVDYYLTQLGIIVFILGPAYFINTYLSLAFKRFSFFLSSGLTFCWFFLHILYFRFAHISESDGLLVMSITSSSFAILCYIKSLKRISAHSITS